MAKNEVPIKVTLEIQGQHYGLVLTHDMSGLAMNREVAFKAGTEVGMLVSRTIIQHFIPEHP
jgi:hypothetical protein